MSAMKIIFSLKKVENAVDYYRAQGYKDVYANELYKRCNGSYMPNKGQSGWGAVNSQWGMEISKYRKNLNLDLKKEKVVSRLLSDTHEEVKSSLWTILPKPKAI